MGAIKLKRETKPQSKLWTWLRLLRPHHWHKNALVLAAAFFGGALFQQEKWLDLPIALACFILLSSAVYALNDFVDAPLDATHPRKRKRPVASRKISPKTAVLSALCLGIFSLLLALLFASAALFFILLGYAMMNLLYCAGLKHLPVVDLLLVCSGFVLRVLAGGIAIEITPSPWLLSCTAVSTFFLAACKRRSEQINSIASSITTTASSQRPTQTLNPQTRKQALSRPVLQAYPTQLLSGLCWGSGLLAVIAFSCYAFVVHPLWVTAIASPLALIGVWRYGWLTSPSREIQHSSQNDTKKALLEVLGETPENLFWRDKLLLSAILAWVLTMAIAVYA